MFTFLVYFDRSHVCILTIKCSFVCTLFLRVMKENRTIENVLFVKARSFSLSAFI